MKIKTNFNLRNDLEKIREEATKHMAVLASDGIGMIIDRTQKGIDLRGKRFAKYTKEYSKYKKKKGRPNSPTNLTFRFRMLANMSAKKSLIGAKIVFTSTDERLKAYYNNFGIGQPQREFFGLTKKEKKIIYDRLSKFIARFL